ncbi:MAG TPA: alpha/beta hydrolase [Sandaracinaceae bacterium LLY-WYZ-13_1]|nr:alpha/beta hydrolase [Sandaracinaceae bacterium LLY-WYZ-13_1]
MPSRLFRRALLNATRARRRMRGPLREAWSLEHEAWSRLLHHYARRSTLLPLAVQRRAVHALARPGLSSVAMHREEADGVPCAWFDPEGADPTRLLVYLHGGGYSIGSIQSHAYFIARIARDAGTRAFAVDYRLAPEHPFPAALDDAKTAWRWLLARGVDPTRTVLAGESAGGGLTVSTLVDLRDEGTPLPAAAATLSPWVDLTLANDSIDANARFDYLPRHVLQAYVERFAVDVDPTHPGVSPVFADLRGLPPLLVQVGEAEALLDDSVALAERAREAGADVQLSVYDDMIHAFQLFAGFPGARPAQEELVRFVREHVGLD